MVILQHIKSKLYESALLQKQVLNKIFVVMRGNRGTTTPKWGYLEFKIDSMCPFARNAQQNFTSEGDFNGTKAWYWLAPKRWVISITNSREWQLFSEPVVMICQICLVHNPTCKCTCRKKRVCSHPGLARVRPARAVEMGTWQVWQSIKAELSSSGRRQLTASTKASPVAWPANSCHLLILLC